MRLNSGKPDAGFTLIELLVAIAIVAILISLVFAGASHFTKIARGTSERQTVVQLNQAVQAFKQEFGFLPPLITHSSTVRPVEFNTANPRLAVPNAYGGQVAAAKSFNGNPAFLEGFSSGNPAFQGNQPMSSDWAAETAGFSVTSPDSRFSEYSLAYYLVGALGRALDGVDGQGMLKPNTDGTFDFGVGSKSSRVNNVIGRTYPSFVNTSRRSPKLETDLKAGIDSDSDLLFYERNSTTARLEENVRVRLLSPSGKPYRYYRWSPRKNGPVLGATRYFNPSTGDFTRLETATDMLNVPSLLGDPATDAELRSAEYAIVSSGPDGIFGDMNTEASSRELLAEMSVKVRVPLDPAQMTNSSIAIRKAARADNVVEVGR